MIWLGKSIKKLLAFYKQSQPKYIPYIVAAACALLVYTTNFQRNFFSKTYTAITMLVFAATFGLSIFLIRYIKRNFVQRFSNVEFWLCLGTAILLSMLLLLNFTPVSLTLLQQDKELKIEVPSGPEPVRIVSIRNSMGYIHYTNLEIRGKWQKTEDFLELENDDGNALSWIGKLDENVEIIFLPTNTNQVVNIYMGGLLHEVDLQQSPNQEQIVFQYSAQPSSISLMPFYVAAFILSGFLLIVLMVMLCTIQPWKIKSGRMHKIEFLLGIPMLITSTLSLLTFWPGMMTTDSITQWKEVVSGNFTDLNPLLHTLFISVLERIGHSPALVAVFQIIAFFLILALGFYFLRKGGVHPAVLVAQAIIIAVWPINLIFVNILWKDILYSFSLLALFSIVLEIGLSKGENLERNKIVILLGIIAFSVASFRHNGYPVAFLTLAALPIFFKKYWKKLLLTFAVVVFAWSMVKGPLKSQLTSKTEVNVNPLNLTYLHHISAHLAAGSAFTEEQISYLNNVLPLEYWQYDCCYMGNIYTHPEFDKKQFLENTSYNLSIVLNLLRQNPFIDIRDQLCASEMDWRFLNNHCTFKSLHPFDFDRDRILSWIPDNDLGLIGNSILPGLVPAYHTLLDSIGIFNGMVPIILRPAFYFFLTIITLVSTSIRLGNKNLLIPAIPILAQTGLLILVNFAPAFRYQYGICLVGLYVIGILFIPQNDNS